MEQETETLPAYSQWKGTITETVANLQMGNDPGIGIVTPSKVEPLKPNLRTTTDDLMSDPQQPKSSITSDGVDASKEKTLEELEDQCFYIDLDNPNVDYKTLLVDLDISEDLDLNAIKERKNKGYFNEHAAKLRHFILQNRSSRTIYSYWKCTVDEVLIKEGGSYPKGADCFVLNFKAAVGVSNVEDNKKKEDEEMDVSNVQDDKKRKNSIEDLGGSSAQIKKMKMMDANTDPATQSADTKTPFVPPFKRNDTWQHWFKTPIALKVAKVHVTPNTEVEIFQPLFDLEMKEAASPVNGIIPYEEIMAWDNESDQSKAILKAYGL